MLVAWADGTTFRRRVVPRGTLADAAKLTQLAAYGLPVRTDNRTAVATFLGAYEEANLRTIPTVRGATTMGWVDDGVFLCGEHVITPTSVAKPKNDDPESWAANGWVALTPTQDGWIGGLRGQGDFQRWRDAIDAVKHW